VRLLVTGGRAYANRTVLGNLLDMLHWGFPELVIGCGYDPKSEKYQGADQLAFEWAKARKVPGRAFPADWAGRGKAAGPERNQRMLERFRPERVLAFPTPGAENRGTKDMMRRAIAAGVKVDEVTL